MSRPKAAQRVAASNVAASLAALLSPARAEASRKNGAKSRGPKTPEGKARSAQNALRHGLRAEKFVVVGDEDPQEFAALEAALVEDLAPEGALQTLLAGRIARAAWRLERAERIEAQLFAREMDGLFGDGDLGLALIRDGNGARAFDVLLRYRGAAQAELFRTLRTLKALQAEAAQQATHEPASGRRARAQPEAAPEQAALAAPPNKPEPRGNPEDSRAALALAAAPAEPDTATPWADPAPALDAAADPAPHARSAAPGDRASGSSDLPIKPESLRNPCDSGRPTESTPSFPSPTAAPSGSASLLAGTALVPIGLRNGA